MAVISVNLTDTFEQWRTKTNTLCTQQGDLTTLTTTAKNTMVAAINEIDAAVAGISNVVEDTTPQLGGNLDVLARIITTSTTNGNIAITPHGSGKVVLDGISHPNADGSNGQVLQTNGSGVLSFATISSDPTMGGDLSGTASNAQIAANTITGTELANNAVVSAHITDGTIIGGDIGSTTITGGNLVNGTITGTQLAANCITSAKITDGTIIGGDIGSTTITGSNLVNSTITATQLAANVITDAEVADNALSGNKIHGGTISSFASTGIDDNADALAMTIDSSERVGIGTTSPTQGRLVVAGVTPQMAINASNGYDGAFGFYENGTGRFFIHASNGANNLRFIDGNNSTEYMRIKAGGNVGIAHTNPSEKLHVTGNILATGNITAYSDERLKTNIKELDNTLNAIQNIRGVSYTRTDTKDNSIGVMAQDVETIFPELIAESNDGMKSVNYNGLVGVLFSAVKELSATVKQLKERNN